VTREAHRQVVLRLLAACQARDEAAISGTLHPRATMQLDSGGHLDTGLEAARGPDPVAAQLVRLLDEIDALAVTEQAVNGGPGLALRSGDRVLGVLSLAIRGGRIREVWAVANADKLGHWQP